MIKCPNCGTMNEAGSRFCFQCGQTLVVDAGSANGSQTQPIAPPSTFPSTTGPMSGFPPPPGSPGSGFPPPAGHPQDPYGAGAGYPPGTPGYMMPPEPPRRRRWLWIILGIILGCILICVALSIYGATSGNGWLSEKLTQVSEYSTQEAN